MQTRVLSKLFFFFNDTATTEIYTLSLHDALPIWASVRTSVIITWPTGTPASVDDVCTAAASPAAPSQTKSATKTRDRKSTRLNSSHANISYAVFCLKKKKKLHLITFAIS